MNVLLFEDNNAAQMYPITTGRLSYAITCGSFRLIDWVRRLELPIFSDVRPYLRTIQNLDYPDVKEMDFIESDDTLILNSLAVPCISTYKSIVSIIEQKRYGVIKQNDSLVAALVPATHKSLQFSESSDPYTRYIETNRFDDLQPLGSEIRLIEFPHDVVQANMSCISENLEFRIKNQELNEIQDGVFVADNVQIGDHCIFETSSGPVIIDNGAKIGPYCFFNGPAYVGENAKIIEHSAIKDAVSLSHTTKIGGEVEASVIEPYTNKQHHGFLGHSYLGSWINLGAGTCNSDLKNTYGKIKMEYNFGKVQTDMQFLGCIMGDYAKSAINTGIFTGKTIGTCSMVYGFVTTNVPSFVNYARLFGQVTELPAEIMVATQQRMFLRRNVDQRPCDIELMKQMYQLTTEERRMAGEPLAL